MEHAVDLAWNSGRRAAKQPPMNTAIKLDIAH